MVQALAARLEAPPLPIFHTVCKDAGFGVFFFFPPPKMMMKLLEAANLNFQVMLGSYLTGVAEMVARMAVPGDRLLADNEPNTVTPGLPGLLQRCPHPVALQAELR